MNVIVIGRKKFTGPKSWDDITPRQFIQLMNWRVRYGADPAGRWVLLQLWYGIRYRHTRQLDADQLVELAGVLDFLDEQPDRWMLPKVHVNTRTYVGPGDGLDYLTFSEFMYAQAARDRYLAEPDRKHLAALAAALYRPRALFFQAQGDAHRMLFDARRYELESRNMMRLPQSVLLGILLNFEGCLSRFPEQFKYLFSGSGEGEGGTWLDVGLGLARQTSALGSFPELERSNLFLVLTTLDAIMKESEELKAKLESANG